MKKNQSYVFYGFVIKTTRKSVTYSTIIYGKFIIVFFIFNAKAVEFTLSDKKHCLSDIVQSSTERKDSFSFLIIINQGLYPWLMIMRSDKTSHFILSAIETVSWMN